MSARAGISFLGGCCQSEVIAKKDGWLKIRGFISSTLLKFDYLSSLIFFGNLFQFFYFYESLFVMNIGAFDALVDSPQTTTSHQLIAYIDYFSVM